jgi:filamentous hemagglutinin family protein
MTYSGWHCRKQSKLAICLTLLEIIIFSTGERTSAQSNIVADDTLLTEKTQIISNVNSLPQERITGGSVRGVNLFHSFREFNVSEGRTAYFVNPVGIENILGRVTGNNRSEILGKLGVLGNANLFLINPNGIIFGAEASLDINGSFVATSANAIKFGEQGFFNASSPEAVPLLTVKPSALFFNQIGAGLIENSSIAAAGVNKVNNPVWGLRIGDGQSLLLVGGNVLNAGQLNALGGRVELASVASAGEIGLSIDGKNLALTFPQAVVRGDILLRNEAIVNVVSDGGGAIALTGNNINISEGSFLLAGIASGLGTSATQAGNITLNATQAISLSQSSSLFNEVGENATGNSGDIHLTAEFLTLTQGSILSSSLFGEGNAGNIIIDVRGTVNLDGETTDGFPSLIASQVGETAIGDSGDIKITAESLTLLNGSFLSNTILGEGNAGNIIIDVRGAVNLDGESRNGIAVSAIASNAEETAIGNGGDIKITAESLTLLNGSILTNSTFGKGNAGNITIDVRGAVQLDGESRDGSVSAIVSNVVETAIGNGGDIKITAESLTLLNGSVLINSTFGKGNAGNITIDVRGAVQLDGETTYGFPTIIASQVGETAIGDSGDIKITAESLNLTQGSNLSTLTSGKGNAGNIVIDVRGVVNLDGQSRNGINAAISTSAEKPAIGDGGDIQITAESLNLNQEAILTARTLGQGKGGNIQIEAAKSVNLSNEAEISVNSQGQGDAGTVKIKTNSLTLQGRSRLLADTVSSEGGNIQLQVGDILLLRDNSSISTTAGQEYSGGNIDINTKFLVAVPGENTDITANAFAGKGGLIQIKTQGIFGIEERNSFTTSSDITAFSQQNPQLDGEIVIDIQNADISNELVALPTNVVDASKLIAQRCSARPVATNQPQSQFIITGRGGLPPQPTDALRIPAIATSVSTNATATQHQSPNITSTLEANSWHFDNQGRVTLTASATDEASTFATRYGNCYGS